MHDDLEDFEGPGADGVQWIGRKGVRGQCNVLLFLPKALLLFLGVLPVPFSGYPRAKRGQ